MQAHPESLGGQAVQGVQVGWRGSRASRESAGGVQGGLDVVWTVLCGSKVRRGTRFADCSGPVPVFYA